MGQQLKWTKGSNGGMIQMGLMFKWFNCSIGWRAYIIEGSEWLKGSNDSRIQTIQMVKNSRVQGLIYFMRPHD